MKYVFGPVNSRRLGKSLGIDIIPWKVCSFNCIYCECGSTTHLTDEVKEYIPYEEIISEIRQALDERPHIDVVTFSGSGEPTLNSRLGDIIKFIKENYPEYKVAVLTNSSLLHRADVRHSLLDADIIYPSLDAVSGEVFNKIMRPVHGTDPGLIIDSIALLRNEFKGILCLEVFIIAGLNDTDEELKLLKDACIKINPHEIHINHLDRPGAEDWIKPVDSENLERVRNYFLPLPVKLVGRVQSPDSEKEHFEKYENSVKDAVHVNGSTAEEIAEKLNMRLFDVLRSLKNLKNKKIVEAATREEGVVYTRIPADRT